MSRLEYRGIRGSAALLAGWSVILLSCAVSPAHAALPDHATWDRILQTHVEGGRVDYAGIREHEARLETYLAELASAERSEFSEAPTDERLAFWINAYNAFTIKLVVDRYPLGSIWEATPAWKRPLGGPFSERFIPLGHLYPTQPLDRNLSLNDIEHEILRKHFDEPRVHFAIVCASRSCPSLSNHAYRGATLDRQLDRATREFLRDPSKNRYDAADDTLYLSRIFRWFRGDFERDGSLLEFVRPYVDAGTAKRLATSGDEPGIEFNAYDWSLNDRIRGDRRNARAAHPGSG